MPNWLPLSCYTAIALGTLSGGWRIVKTMGSKITKVTPLEGFCAEGAGALTLFLIIMLGIPVSTTHTISGAYCRCRRYQEGKCRTMEVTINLLWAWVLTILISGPLAMLLYWILKLVF